MNTKQTQSPDSLDRLVRRGDTVRLRGKTETAVVKSVGPGTVNIGVALRTPIEGYMTWPMDDLEVVTPNAALCDGSGQ